MNKLLVSLALALIFFGTSVNASAVTLDFQEFAGEVGTFQPLGPVVETKGFEVVPSDNAVWFEGWYKPDNISIGLFSGSITIAAADGSLFNFLGFDYDVPGNTLFDVSVVNNLNQTVNFQLNLPDLTSSSNDPLTTYDANGLFDSIKSITLYDSGQPLLDNFRVAAVPIPAAVWLFGSALAGLGWIRRKHSV